MMKTLKLLALTIFLPLVVHAGQLPPGFIEEELATGLNPTDLAISSDGRIFIAEKNGSVLLWRDGRLLSTPFMELAVDDTNERGLQSIVLDPDFEQNGYLYIYYSHPNNLTNRVSRFTANGDRVLPGSELLLYEMDAVISAVHNGGGMSFLPDGSLLFTVGDGAATWRSQFDDQTHGKAIRIWPDGTIPDDNPKIYGGGKYEALVAKGFRNPFNVAVNEAGRIFVNDVGSDKFEEINELEFGHNYGWPFLEGIRTNQNIPPDYMDPFHAYDHNIGCAVVGGTFCPVDNLHFPEEYRGQYFFSDYCKGYIKVLDITTGDVSETFATEIDRPLRLTFDAAGRMYYFERAGLGGGSANDNTSSSNGRLLRVTYTGNGIPVISRDPRDVLVSVSEDARFEVSANGGQPLSYAWYINDTEVPGADSNVFVIPDVLLNQSGDEVHCIVFNQEGRDTSATAILEVTDNQRPEPSILLLTDSLYTAGEPISVRGTATDAEDGMIPPEDFVWWVDFHHDLHTHPALKPTSGVGTINYDVPAVGEIDDNVWYRIYLSVTDAGGLPSLTFLDVYPKKINISYRTEPSGLNLNIDGNTEEAPVDIPSVAGIEHICVPVSFQSDENNAYLFANWNGQFTSEQFRFRPEQDVEVTARFDTYILGEGSGLFGEYFNFFNGQPVFEGEPAISRVDSTINFYWDESPNDSLINKDSFLVSWTGFVEPIFDGNYAFGVDIRNAARLFIDGELLIDEWILHPRSFFTTDSVFLESGKRYPVAFEMYKSGGPGVAGLYWSADRMSMRLIPTSQLYTIDTSVDDSRAFDITIGPNPTSGDLIIKVVDQARYDDRLLVFDIQGRLVLEKDLPVRPAVTTHLVHMADFPRGIYLLEILRDGERIFESKVIRQ